MTCLINPVSGTTFSVSTTLDQEKFNQHWTVRLRGDQQCLLKLKGEANLLICRSVMPDPAKFQHEVRAGGQITISGSGQWCLLVHRQNGVSKTDVSLSGYISSSVEVTPSPQPTESNPPQPTESNPSQPIEPTNSLTGLLGDKWNRTSLVATNSGESEFIYNSQSERRVMERFTYYYHSLEVWPIIQEWLRSPPKGMDLSVKKYPIAQADLFQVIPESTAAQLREIFCLKIRRTGSTPQYRALFVAGTHAREAATLPTLLNFADRLLANHQDSQQYLDQWEINLVFLVNPLGHYIDNHRVATQGSNLENVPGNYHRKNDRGITSLNLSSYPKRQKVPSVHSGGCGDDVPSLIGQGRGEVGVDLNRNLGENFQFEGRSSNYWSSSGSGETYPGPSPNSEKESKIFQQIFSDIDPHLFITVHSYGNMIVTSDVYDDSPSMSASLKQKASQYRLSMKSYHSVPSLYRFSNVVEDYPYYQSVTRGTLLRHRDPRRRGIGELVNFPSQVCPLGTARGEMTHWAYVRKHNQSPGQPFNAFTLELGTSGSDGFYPNKYEMIDIVFNGWNLLLKSLKFFHLINYRS
jgi:hypothetical protein